MTPFSELSIRQRLRLTTLVASGVALLLSSAAFMIYDWTSFQNGVIRRLRSQAEIVGFNSATAIVFADPDSGRKTLSALQAEPQILAAALYARDGSLFAKYERPGVGSASLLPQALHPDSPGLRFGSGRLGVFRPIVFEGERVGSLYIVSDLSERIFRLERYVAIAGVVSVAALFVAALVGSRAQRSLTERILSLSNVSRAVSERSDLTARAAPEGADELGRLVATFNGMLATIQGREEQLRKAYERAEEAGRLKDQFLATLSHELRTPLNAIVGWSHMLRSGGLDADTSRKALDTISRNAMTQTQLIADILDMQRITSGKLRLNLSAVDPAPVIEAALDTVRPAAAAKEIDLQTVIDPGTGPILADSDRLQQIVWNLLSNAVKFGGKGGHVRVGLIKVNSHIEIAVEDNGPGLDPAFIPFAFDRFRQADASSTRRHGGLGLGLAIVRDLTELHGGSVTAGNRTTGTGAIFTVKLPRMSVASANVTPSGTSMIERRNPTRDEQIWLEAAPRLHGIRVLVVDDQLDARELIASILGACGADVMVESSAADGLARLQVDRPDVLLSDIEMPGEDGYALIAQVRALPANRGGATPAAALTAYASTADRMRALTAGFQLHVAKPVQPAELATVIASLATFKRDAGAGSTD
jgi:signal transduction histidine kinase/ActR/RegA family two-component response regulator